MLMGEKIPNAYTFGSLEYFKHNNKYKVFLNQFIVYFNQTAIFIQIFIKHDFNLSTSLLI